MRHALIEFRKELEVVLDALTPSGIVVLPVTLVKRRVQLYAIELRRVIPQLVLREVSPEFSLKT